MVEAAIQPEAAVELRPKYSPPYYFRPDGRAMGSRRPLFSFAVFSHGLHEHSLCKCASL